MIVVEFRLGTPALRETLSRTSEVRVEWERSDTADGERVHLLFWAEADGTDEFGAFEAALEDDPSVTAPTALVEVGGRRLYRAELRGEALERAVYPVLVEIGAVVRAVTVTASGWECHIAFPDRAAVDRFFDHCDEHGVETTVHRLYQERGEGSESSFGLTESQREILAAAVELGYLDVPRRVDLKELGEHLGISDTAASQRFRRGVRALVERTLLAMAGDGRERDDDPPD
ncbi:helix-turn-helix domain-containing protein [Halobium palmae]|uniref:Helix-turn-helix domain-containing protein n=1 Tax=Halobium palmae TaxID=1776492 RepID=A0ABD5RYL7_9EURY